MVRKNLLSLIAVLGFAYMDSPKTGRFPVKLPMRRVKPVAGATVMVDGTSTGNDHGHGW